MSEIKIKDSGMAIFVAGSISTIFELIYSWTLYGLGLTKQTPSILHTRLLTDRFTFGTWELILGILSSFAAGIFFTGVIWFVFKVFGSDYAVAKGAFVGFINAMIQFLFFTRLFYNPVKVAPDIATLWHVFLGYTLWGMIGAYLLRKLYDVKPFGEKE